MRCKACDKLMNDYELSRVDPLTGQYHDMCTNCLKASQEAAASWSDKDLEEIINFEEALDNDGC